MCNPHTMHPDEWQLRVDLAACYRLVALYGWSDLVFTHISAKLPASVAGEEHQFLINPYGLMFDEITASSLVKVDMQCNKLDDSPHPVNPAGFVEFVALHVHLDQARRGDFVEHQAVGVDQELLLAARDRGRQLGADVGEHQIAPAVQGHQPVAGGQVDAQGPFVGVHGVGFVVHGVSLSVAREAAPQREGFTHRHAPLSRAAASLPGPGQLFQSRKEQPGVAATVVAGAAHLGRRHQLATHRRALRLTKNAAAQVFVQLHAAHPRRLALGHAWNRRTDGGRGAAGTAAGAARHLRHAGLHLGHSTHRRSGCLSRPASSPASVPEPA